jgi:riboflavin biosynthesis pyrimidine reductase
MTRLEVLYEADGLPSFDLPESLREVYGGSLGFGEPRLVANFVSTVDGIVALPALTQSNKLISGGSEADRLVMGLLRATADAVLIGSGTLRGSPGGDWTPERAYPPAAAEYANLRRRLGRPAKPEVLVLTGSGDVNPAHPVFEAGAVVLTTVRGESALAGRLPGASTVLSLGDRSAIDPRAAVELLRARGHRIVHSEAGPHTFASLVEAGLVDELVLTVSPLLAGHTANGAQLGLAEGRALLPGTPVGGRLLSVRRDGAHLLLRYELSRRSGTDFCSDLSCAAPLQRARLNMHKPSEI